ncbi:MAG: DinB family protein [Actinobacteria bacterium]|nr:DinB family protein [Actinomycetota bacterium]
MPEPDAQLLLRYLQVARDALVWKLEGLSPYDQRRPLTPTGTNLLGLVKHLAGVEFGYFGDVLGRPVADRPAWMDDENTPNVDMFASADESGADILALYRRAWAHTDAAVAELGLDGTGEVPWWPPARNPVTVRQLLVHVTAETHRHAGHADLVRELIDGAAGLRADNDNLPEVAPTWWPDHVAHLEAIARDATA